MGMLLSTDIVIQNRPDYSEGPVTFELASRGNTLFDLAKSALRAQRRSLHADLLHARHAPDGPLAGVTTEDEVMAADFLLFLRSMLGPAEAPFRDYWEPWSCLYLRRAPRFLLSMTSKHTAECILPVLNVSSLQVFRDRLPERAPLVRNTFPGFGFGFRFDLGTLGTRP